MSKLVPVDRSLTQLKVEQDVQTGPSSQVAQSVITEQGTHTMGAFSL